MVLDIDVMYVLAKVSYVGCLYSVVGIFYSQSYLEAMFDPVIARRRCVFTIFSRIF